MAKKKKVKRKAVKKAVKVVKRGRVAILPEKVVEDLLDVLQAKAAERRERNRKKLKLVSVRFAGSGRLEYTYFMPKEVTVGIGEDVLTPTGPAKVSSFPSVPEPGRMYKYLKGYYPYQDFKYD